MPGDSLPPVVLLLGKKVHIPRHDGHENHHGQNRQRQQCEGRSPQTTLEPHPALKLSLYDRVPIFVTLGFPSPPFPSTVFADHPLAAAEDGHEAAGELIRPGDPVPRAVGTADTLRVLQRWLMFVRLDNDLEEPRAFSRGVGASP